MAWLSPILWPFLRVLAVFSVAPVFSMRTVPMRVKIGLAFLVALCAQGVLGDQPVISVNGREAFGAVAQQVAVGLRLSNLRGVHARVEKITEKHGLIVSRAFASLPDFVNWSGAALEPGGVWMAMKGKHPTEELAALPAHVDVFHVEQLQIPGLEAQRCLVWMRPKVSG